MSITRVEAAPKVAPPRFRWLAAVGRGLPTLLWGIASIGCFAGAWEILWAIGWLLVAIFLFGIGNGPAIFMVVIALLFHMVLATVNQIDNVNRNLINVARTMGASKRQTYARVIFPAILPQLFVVLRFNLFAAWMVVLVAEATGVGYGLGQVIMLARNTFNPSLVFFTIFLI